MITCYVMNERLIMIMNIYQEMVGVGLQIRDSQSTLLKERSTVHISQLAHKLICIELYINNKRKYYPMI